MRKVPKPFEFTAPLYLWWGVVPLPPAQMEIWFQEVWPAESLHFSAEQLHTIYGHISKAVEVLKENTVGWEETRLVTCEGEIVEVHEEIPALGQVEKEEVCVAHFCQSGWNVDKYPQLDPEEEGESSPTSPKRVRVSAESTRRKK